MTRPRLTPEELDLIAAILRRREERDRQDEQILRAIPTLPARRKRALELALERLPLDDPQRQAPAEWEAEDTEVRLTRMLDEARAKDPEGFPAALRALRASYPATADDVLSHYAARVEKERAARGAKMAAAKKRAKYPEKEIHAAVAKAMEANPDASPRARNTAIKHELRGRYPDRDFSRWIQRYIDEYLAKKQKR